MTIQIRHPIDYVISIYSATGEKGKFLKSEQQKNFVFDYFDIPESNEISINIFYNKHSCKLKFFKQGWYSYLFSNPVSFSYYVRQRVVNLLIKSRDTSILEIYFDYEFINPKINGNIIFLKIDKIESKKSSVKSVSYKPVSKIQKRKILSSLLAEVFLNILSYLFIPVMYLLLIIFYPDLIWGYSPLDYLVVVFFGIIAIINMVRYIANFIETMRLLNQY